MIEHHTDLLLLRDGRILAHNLTPTMAAVLRKLGPENRPRPRGRVRPPAKGPKKGGSL